MNDPTSNSRPWKDKVRLKRKHESRKHTNHKFYNSASWRRSRKDYIQKLTEHQWEVIMFMEDKHKMYLLDKVPICERCLELYLLGAYDIVDTAKELDHTNPINPSNALDTEKGKWGEPLDQDNYKFLCRTHHAKKSQRDKKIVILRTR